MGGSWGRLKKNMPIRKGQPKKITLKAREIKVSKGKPNQGEIIEMGGLADHNSINSSSNIAEIDFDANVGIWFMKKELWDNLTPRSKKKYRSRELKWHKMAGYDPDKDEYNNT